MRTNCDEIELSSQVVGNKPVQIMPDGTGFKGEGKHVEARKGDLKVVIGITIILKRFADSSDWGNYWDKKMNILTNVIVLFRNYKASSQNFGQ